MSTSLTRDFADEVDRVAPPLIQFIKDNPVQMAAIFALGLCSGKILMNLVKPRTPIEFAAVLLVGEVLVVPTVSRYVLENDLLKFKVRDSDGKLIPLRPTILKEVAK